MIHDVTLFACPVCAAQLSAIDAVLRCENGHSYDISRRGWVNLLMSNKSAKKRHGDDKLMVRARADFLNKGYYAPLRDSVAELVCAHTPAEGAVLDIGCGEGYYTGGVSQRLPAAQVYGIDISKTAIDAAAKANAALSLAVASAFSLPLMDGSVDVVMNLFAPFSPQEVRRVMKPDGAFIHVLPLEKHLWSLKELVYDEPYENKPADLTIDGFEIAEKREIKSRITVSSREDIANLFKMTPYYYKTSKEDQAKLDFVETLETETEFGIVMYKKVL